MSGYDNKFLGDRPKQKRTKGKSMSDVFAAQSLFREAFPLRRYGKLENVFFESRRFISRLVHKDFTQRRARSIYEGTARRIDAEEMEALKAALLEENRREQRELRARLAALDEKLAVLAAAGDREAVARPFEEMGR